MITDVIAIELTLSRRCDAKWRLRKRGLFLFAPGLEVIKLFSCSAQLRLKFILLINVKMPTVVGILTFISRINYRLWRYKPSISIYFGLFGIYLSSDTESINF